MNMRQVSFTAMACLIVASLVAGCGKKGRPKPPDSAQKTEQQVN